MKTIYIVDDEESIVKTIQSILKDEGYKTIGCGDAEIFLNDSKKIQPDLILLDIWLPGMDGMEMLKIIKNDAKLKNIPVIMMSGHAGVQSAVNAIKLGAFDFLEKPLHLDVLLKKILRALKSPSTNINDKNGSLDKNSVPELKSKNTELKTAKVSLLTSEVMQKTIKKNVVLNGTGLLSGKKTGIILSPLNENEGIVFQSLDGISIKSHIDFLDELNDPLQNKNFSANSTVLTTGTRSVKTVEHLLGCLSMMGISNLLIKTEEEIPNIDGSAKDFCLLIQEAGIIEQNQPVKYVVVHDKFIIGTPDTQTKHLIVEPYDGFMVNMRVDYDKPIYEQSYSFDADKGSFIDEIAPARTFNTFENIDLAQKSGKAGSGYLDSHIIIHEGKVINTDLRFEDEFVRHKILDLIGDFYLLGHPLRAKITANMTSHAFNQSMVHKINQQLYS